MSFEHAGDLFDRSRATPIAAKRAGLRSLTSGDGVHRMQTLRRV